MIIGYQLSALDDDSAMLGPDTYRPSPRRGFHDWRYGSNGVPHVATCPSCGRKTDPNYVSPTYRVRKRRRDATATYDGYTLVSARFKADCEREGWGGIEFVRLPADDQFFWLRPNRIVEFDAVRRETRFEESCDTCHAYYSVVGATPVYLRDIREPLAEGFYRTDLEFASGPEQHPLIIVGPRTGEQIVACRYPVLDVHTFES